MIEYHVCNTADMNTTELTSELERLGNIGWDLIGVLGRKLIFKRYKK